VLLKRRGRAFFYVTIIFMARAKKIVVANWKMNPSTLAEAEKLFDGVKKKASRLSNVETVLCPPFVYLTELFVTYSGNKIKFGAQDVFWEDKGPRTGEISPLMLKSIGVEYSIIGPFHNTNAASFTSFSNN